MDATSGTLEFFKQTGSVGAFVSQGVAFTSGIAGGNWTPFAYLSSGGTLSANFGQKPFNNTSIPTGFNSLSTTNLPTPTIVKPNQYFDATLWNGDNAASHPVVNSGGFAPDFVWIKPRTTASAGWLLDTNRGISNALQTSNTNGDAVNSVEFTSFNPNGFTVGSSSYLTNQSGQNFVAWNWKAGGTAVANTAGSITSQVSANPTAGFSIVTYTGAGVNATVGHGLNSVPKMVIVKSRSFANGWLVYHVNTSQNGYTILSATNAYSVQADWNNTTPTSSVFSISSSINVNQNSSSYVAYLWSEVLGFSKFGSYTGNGSADGPFVYTGFRPRYVMIKRTDGPDSWVIEDTARDSYNTDMHYILADNTMAEGTTALRDVLSNGFKMRSAAQNISGATYIYAAFAEAPFKYANAR